MTTVIRNGTIVTADLTYPADVRIENGRIAQIGPNLTGDTILDATGCYVMPGGIDPHTHLEMPFMGTYSADDFDSGTRAALAGGTTMVIDFALPSPDQGLLDALKVWDNKTARAKGVGALIAQRAKDAGVTKVSFDRGGYKYHGRIAALADAAREGGLEF